MEIVKNYQNINTCIQFIGEFLVTLDYYLIYPDWGVWLFEIVRSVIIPND